MAGQTPYLDVQHLTKSFGAHVLFEDISFSVAEGQKIGLVAQNGTGKSTLLSIITGAEGYDSGDIIFRRDLRVGYLEQTPKFNPEDTVLDACFNHAGDDEKILKAKQILTQLKLGDLGQTMGTLSGGQQRRVALANVLITEPDMLVLDEPTNDLDIVTLQVLEEYLQNFKGCVIVVSHDRYFMDKVVDHLLVFKGQGDIRDFPGNYSDYRDWKLAKAEHEKEAAKPKEEKTQRVRLNDKRRMTFKERKEFEQLEKEIAALEEEKKQTEEALCSGTLSVDELTEKSKRLPLLNDELDEKTMRWLELSEIEG